MNPSSRLQDFVDRAAERSRALARACGLRARHRAADVRSPRAATRRSSCRSTIAAARTATTRNLIYEAPDDSLSLYSIVWLPGQWTPVHDHGSWGIVGVSRACSRSGATCACHRTVAPTRHRPRARRHHPAAARRGHELRAESRSHSPDGCAAERPRAVSLHLYGRMMSDFNIYDVEARTRRRINVAHNES
jgi:predicted metal-dependent enzyme (double-stranded beta helix superfamily)